jgi:hypothetical protein
VNQMVGAPTTPPPCMAFFNSSLLRKACAGTALYRAVESRPVVAAGLMTRECVGRKSI